MSESITDLLARYAHLTTEQVQELYRCHVEGRLPPATMPKERLAAIFAEQQKTPRQKLEERHKREQRARFMDWLQTKDTATLTVIVQKLATGTPSERIMKDFS